MAAPSNFRVVLDRAEEPTSTPLIPLEALPFPAALTGPDGTIVATNAEWLTAYPSVGLGENSRLWAECVPYADAIFRAELALGIRGALEGRRFVQDCGENPRFRFSASPCGQGVLLIAEEVECAEPDSAGEQKRHAQKMQTVGRLVGGVAHDFANLLTLISGYTDLLLNRLSEYDPIRTEIDEIRKAANRGSRLTAQLLGFTRGQAIQPKVLDLNTVVNDVQRMLRPLIGEYVEFQTALAPNLGKILADSGQMEQVIMNLILNARDAMPTGGFIGVETANCNLDAKTAQEHSLEPGPFVMLCISDTGHGIPPEAMDKLFEPFFTTKEHGKGTGLGLSTVQGIVKRCGGGIWAFSDPGRGAKFTVCLPRAGQGGEIAESAPVARTAATGSETILVVEDEEGVRRLLTHILNKRGYHVLEASNGEEALEIFSRQPADIHLVLTDMVMPKMSGRELAERVRKIQPDANVIYMSGYTDDVLVRTGSLSPGMNFLQKPLRPETLATKVREALDSSNRPFDPR